MDRKFYFGMKVSLGNEVGIVVKVKEETEWNNEPGFIRWDTSRENDLEDWRGLAGTFWEMGGEEITSDFEFKYITDEGQLKL